MTIDPRRERNIESVKNLASFLADVYKNPKDHLSDEALFSCLKSQDKISKFENPERGILSSSINTLKRSAEEVLPGGFRDLDDLRRISLDKLIECQVESRAVNKETKTAIKKRLAQAGDDVHKLREDLLLATHAIRLSLKYGRSYAEKSNDASVLSQCEADQRYIFEFLGKHLRIVIKE